MLYLSQFLPEDINGLHLYIFSLGGKIEDERLFRPCATHRGVFREEASAIVLREGLLCLRGHDAPELVNVSPTHLNEGRSEVDGSPYIIREICLLSGTSLRICSK